LSYMKTKLSFGFVFVAFSLLAILPEIVLQLRSRPNVDCIVLGMTQQKVIDLLGPPSPTDEVLSGIDSYSDGNLGMCLLRGLIKDGSTRGWVIGDNLVLVHFVDENVCSVQTRHWRRKCFIDEAMIATGLKKTDEENAVDEALQLLGNNKR
jgi:hypothetical protein